MITYRHHIAFLSLVIALALFLIDSFSSLATTNIVIPEFEFTPSAFEYLPFLVKEDFLPTITPTPTKTGTFLPNPGNWEGSHWGLPVSFTVSADSKELSSFLLTTSAFFGACGVIEFGEFVDGPINIVNNQFKFFSYNFSFDGEFTSSTTAKGTYTIYNYYIYPCGSVDQTGSWTTTYAGNKGINGMVTYQGNPIGGINVTLRRCTLNGSDWTCSDLFTESTQSDGSYHFTNAPSLALDQKYYVRYTNGRDGNADNSDYLYRWVCESISSFTAGANHAGGDFDIADIVLVSPADGATVALPYTFQWTRRAATTSDDYEFNLYDPDDYDPWWWTDPPLEYVSSYTLSELPSGEGFSTGIEYYWDVWVYGPDGYGISYLANSITFSNGETSSQYSTKRLHKHNIEDMPPR